MSLFSGISEEKINEIIEKSIRETLVIKNDKSISFTIEKIKSSLKSEHESMLTSFLKERLKK